MLEVLGPRSIGTEICTRAPAASGLALGLGPGGSAEGRRAAAAGAAAAAAARTPPPKPAG